MPQSTAFARHADDKSHRGLRFLKSLERSHMVYLHDFPVVPVARPGRSIVWRTHRLRPQITAAIDALQERYAAQNGVDLTTSEIIAALLIEALPIVTARDFRG
ncbi:MAG: hypothetical protein ACK4VZ_11560 [Paracoccaceae bacterium]